MEKTLVIMAAGMGSRFGGLKQIEPVGPNKEIIADYSVYDAINVGFTRVVFIIKEEHLTYFEENITKKFKDKIQVDYAFQKLENVIEGTRIPENRVKMWGTTHAIYSAKELINGPFMVINADDFYGAEAYRLVSRFFDNNQNEDENYTVTYPIGMTASPNGSVKRGVCFIKDKEISEVKECEIFNQGENYLAKSLTSDEELIINKDHPVSLNCFGFKKTFMDYVIQDFTEFCQQELDEKTENLLPYTIQKFIKNGSMKMLYDNSHDEWLGVTYKEDLPKIKAKILDMINRGLYPHNLWGEDDGC